MSTPSPKAKDIEQYADSFSFALFGRTRTGSIKQDVCVSCGKAVNSFRDGLSKKEYTISGICQECQDLVFIDPEEY